MRWGSFYVVLMVGLSTLSHAVSVGEKAKDNSVEAQLAAFKIHEDFEINLFADESMGIANPVAMHWDKKGRLWVLTTLTYAQLEPGEKPNDTLVILEDTDEDGKADKSTVFADGLEMPMGFALGYGGVFLGEGPDLLFLEDTDGDDRADTREVLLTGFGTGDTHQNISNFTWGPDGCLYFCQGLHCYSRVETPWGIVRGDTAGFFRFYPESLRLEPFCFPSLASQNPCGITFDKTGALFIKSNNKELIYATPGLIPTTHQKNLVPIASLGSTPGKSMGGEYVDSPHLPDWIQNHILIAGYYSHRVTAFPLVKEGAGYAPVTPVEVLVSEHGSFRPVEVRIGPDGAMYVADWFNPIIGHYQASLRHPDRDEEHGRVWRITAKGRELQRPNGWPQAPRGDVSDVEDKIPFGGSNYDWFAGNDDPRRILSLLLYFANSGDPSALPGALRALDSPRDRFIDYALEQTVHALAPIALPEITSGKLTFAKPEHLAYTLKTLGGEQALSIARDLLSSESFPDSSREAIAVVIGQSGGAQDLLTLLGSKALTPTVLKAMADAARRQNAPAAEEAGPALESLLRSENGEMRKQSLRLIGSWKVVALGSRVSDILSDESGDSSLRGEAAKALAKLEGAKSVDPLLAAYASVDGDGKPAVLEALVAVAPIRAAQTVLASLKEIESPEAAIPFLSPFFNRKDAPGHLANSLKGAKLSPDAAGHLASAMSRMGRSEEALLGILQDAMGMTAGARVYSPDFVAKLMAEVAEDGDAAAGEKVYQRAELTCVACHRLEGVGGIIGPSLDTVGAGLTPDLLIESVLWPQRQLKEGYFAVSVTTKGGDTWSGYREKEEAGTYFLRDTASGEIRTIPRLEISKLDNIGSLMPPGLTNGLSREELRDLIAYLATLKG
ncbi:MAG: c-type cytochrome [Verrucomicrobiales bacterium]|nr:c-type cytochrome [Verrucomicrobiales bacterium]